ncbi:MAG: AraC family transcriptional regulator [Acidobacteriota bacterium]
MVSYTKYSDIEVFEGKIAKHQYPWHFHYCYTLITVEKGSINYEFEDKSLKLDEAEAIIIEPYKIHRNTISQPTTYKALFLPNEYFDCAGQNKLATEKLNHPNLVDSIVDLLNKIELHSSKKELKEILFELLHLIDHPQIEKNNDFPSGINIIPKIDFDLPITELAEKAHLSKFHFQRKFKKTCGLTIGQLKQQEKTNIAKTLLENGMLSTDVAYELGFFDQSHFIKYFKKMWAITPKNFK